MLIDPQSPADKPETEQMVVIHQAMRREFALLPDLVAAVPDGDTAAAGLVGNHLDLMLGMLHEHHESEDIFLWPKLQQRVPIRKELIDVMEHQHHVVADSVTAIGKDLPTWIAGGNATERDRIAAGLRSLLAALTEHLQLEEEAVLPLIHEHLTVSEWLEPQHRAMKHGPKSLSGKLTLAGVVLEDATARQHAWFLSEMPPPARVLWRLFGARRYQAHVRAVRAVATR